MRQPLKLLIVEDSTDDLHIILRMLDRGGFDVVFERVETEEAFSRALPDRNWDVIISDYNLPSFNALEALRLLQESELDIPFLIVSGAIGEEVAVTAMKTGAHDYILKNSLARLVPAVQRELREARGRNERHRTETALAALSQLGQNLAAAGTPIEAARVISGTANDLFHWDAFTLDLYFAQEDQLQPVLNVQTFAGEKIDLPCDSPAASPGVMSRRVIQSGAELIVQEPHSDDGADASPMEHTEPASASGMCVAIRNRTRVIGLMSIHSHRDNVFDHLSLRTLQTLGDYCGGALERIQAREELRMSQEQLRALAAHLQSVREEERKLMTREIHDELGQALTGFKMDLVWIRNRLQADAAATCAPPILEKMVKMGALIDSTANLMRRLCTELRPGVLDDLGLAAAIEWQAREYQNRTGIVCEVNWTLGELAVDAERSTALFRIFQEILTNVARHARATKVEASIRSSGTDLILEVKDNGRGITKSEMGGKKSLGLLGMRERAVILGGEVEIRGAPGKGTTVKARMPLSPSDAALAKPTLSETPQESLTGENAVYRDNQKTKRKVTK